MRSNKGHATRFLLRRNLFIGIIVFLMAFYMMPFWGLSHIPNEKATFADTALYTTEEAAKGLTHLVSESAMFGSFNLETAVTLYGGLGFLTAMVLMGHLFGRRQSLMHAALPDRRETDFLRRCAAYAVLCLAPIMVNFLLYLLIVAANGLMGYVAWGRLLPRFGMLVLINVYGFAMGMLCSVMTGTWWAAILAGAVLIVGMETFAGMWYSLSRRYLYTLTEASFMGVLKCLSPAYTMYKGFYQPAEANCWPGILAVLLALALSFVLYRIRKTERAERTLAFGVLSPVMGVVLSLMGGTALGVVFEACFLTEGSLIAGMIVGAALTFWVCRIAFSQRICGILTQWMLPAASAVVLVLGVAVLHTDAMGFDGFLPERGELTAITYQPRNFDTDEVVTLTGEEALDAAYEWCGLMRGEVEGYADGRIDQSRDLSGSDVMVTYQMGSRKVYRHYPNRTVRNEAQDSLKRIIESDNYRQSMISRLDSGHVSYLYIDAANTIMNQKAFYEKFNTRSLSRRYQGKVHSVTIELLFDAMKQDILNRTFAERQESPILNVWFTIQSPDNGFGDVSMNVYPGDEHTLRAIFGEQADEVVAYVRGGFAQSEDIAVLKVDYAKTVGESLRTGMAVLRNGVKSVTLAATGEEAMRWIAKAQDTNAYEHYYMPCRDDEPLTRLYVYQLSDVARESKMYGYEVPENKEEFYANEDISTMMVLNYVGKN